MTYRVDQVPDDLPAEIRAQRAKLEELQASGNPRAIDARVRLRKLLELDGRPTLGATIGERIAARGKS